MANGSDYGWLRWLVPLAPIAAFIFRQWMLRDRSDRERDRLSDLRHHLDATDAERKRRERR